MIFEGSCLAGSLRWALVLVMASMSVICCSQQSGPLSTNNDSVVVKWDTNGGKPDVGPGETLDSAPDVCLPKCNDKEGGPDGCGGSCGDCEGESICNDYGVCVEPDCAGQALSLTGVFNNNVQDFEFDSVDVDIYHKMDVDPEEDGCISRVDLTFHKGSGCQLFLRAEKAFDKSGALRISALEFSVDSQCPGFSDSMEGTYEGVEKMNLASVALEDTELAVDNVASWCYPSNLVVSLAGNIFSMSAGAQLEILPTELTIAGSFESIGKDTVSCPCKPLCTGKECGGDGCGWSCGTCQDGYYCEAGKCAEGECVPDCDSKECGTDGCGGNCGACDVDMFCIDGKCKEEECLPQCDTKDCGPDGCGGGCGDCGCGETCEGGNCIFHACDGKECGDDGCGGECGECSGNMACSNGSCQDVGCQSEPLKVDGDFNNTVSPITFDSVQATMVHKRDVDEWEDGCISSVELLLKKGSGCTLKVVAGGKFGLDNKLGISEVTFSADSQCPGFSDADEGVYTGGEGLSQAKLEMGVEEVPGYDVPESCVNTWFKIQLDGALDGDGGKDNLVLNETGIEVSGDFISTGDYSAICPCKPSCFGKECGDAGCGFTCGNCGCGETCVGGQCDFTACDGKECGDNGCGGGCGDCTEFPGSYCNGADQCQCDSSCDDLECSSDGCGGSCGECGCGMSCVEGTCEFGACTGKECGPDGCGGSCGECPGQQEQCQDGTCVCVPDCSGKECGPDGCGGECGVCDCGENCQGEVCVFHACEGVDCGPDGCGGSCGDCGCGMSCVGGTCEFGACAGKECGPDGCGGSCGECLGQQEQCQDSTCVCVPDCSGKECGPDGCGGECGSCPGQQSACENSICVCVPNCTNKDCGNDGCGGGCGEFGGDCPGLQEVCTEGICVCQPDCKNKECGPDGCGANCGQCGESSACLPNGKCCSPSCDAKQCGSDGCGGECGICGCGEACDNGVCLFHACDEIECGPDGCGGECGICDQGFCLAGECFCHPECEPMDECGPDGCGGSCGLCDCWEECLYGQCENVTCLGKDCGDNGCGGDCGPCPSGQSCIDERCVPPNYQWALLFGGEAQMLASRAVGLDQTGSILVAGDFKGESFVAGGQPVENTGSFDVFAAKWDEAGNHIWSIGLGSENSERLKAAAVAAGGGVSLAGHFDKPGLNLGTGVLSHEGSTDIFIANLDKDGGMEWSAAFGGSGEDVPGSIALAPDGGIVLSGHTSSPELSFGDFNLLSQAETWANLWIANLSGDGTPLWAKGFGGFGQNAQVAVSNTGHIYLAGNFVWESVQLGGEVLVNSGGYWKYNGFIAKFDPSGNHVWSQALSGQEGSQTTIAGMAVDGVGCAYVTGSFVGTMELAGHVLESQSGQTYVAKLEPDGSFSWATMPESDGSLSIESLSVDALGSVLAGGYFYGETIDFGGGAVNHVNPKLFEACANRFLVRLDQMGDQAWLKRFGTNDCDPGGGMLRVKTAPGGTILATGWFHLSGLDFGGGPLVEPEGWDSSCFVYKAWD